MRYAIYHRQLEDVNPLLRISKITIDILQQESHQTDRHKTDQETEIAKDVWCV